MKLQETLGINLSRLRRAAEWSQVRLASEAELDRAAISRLENGNGNPRST